MHNTVHNKSLISTLFILYSITTLIAMAPMSIMGVVVLITGLYLYFKNKSELELANNPAIQTQIKIHGMFFLFCFVSLLSTHFFPITLANTAHMPQWSSLQKLWFLILPISVTTVLTYQNNYSSAKSDLVKKTMDVVWGVTILLGLLAAVQYFTGWPRPQTIPTTNRYHATLFLGHHLSVTSVLIFPTMTACAYAVVNFIENKKINWLATLASFAGILIMFLSYSRMAWLATPVLLLVLLLWVLPKKLKLVLLAAFIISIVVLYQQPFIQSRLNWHSGINERFELWKMAWALFQERPWTGIGWLQFHDISKLYFLEIDPEGLQKHFTGHAHNIFLEMLSDLGIFGFLSWLTMILYPMFLGIKISKSKSIPTLYRSIAIGITIALLGILLNGLTQVNFWEGKVAHQIMLGIGILLYFGTLNKGAHDS